MTTESIDPQLRRNSLGLPELIFQSVTHIAPATNMVFTYPIIALKAGPDMPLSFLLATMVCFFIGNTVAQFSRYMPSSGGYYSFATRGLGPRIGFMATWSYLVYELLGGAGSTGFLGYLLSDTLRTGFGVHIPWWLIALLTFAVIWTLTHYGIQLSVRVTAVFGRTRAADHAVARHHFPDPSRTGFQLYCAAQSVGSAASSWRDPGGNGFLHPLAQRVRRVRRRWPRNRRRASKFVGQAVILSLVVTGALLHLYFLCQRHRLGHWRHGGLRHAPESVLRAGPQAVGDGVVVRGAGADQQRHRSRPGHAPTQLPG